MEHTHLVFVYGTLRQSRGNHQLLEGALFHGVGNTKQKYAMYLVGGFPHVISTEQRYPIVGELYAVDDEILKKLDRLEGHPIYYARNEVVVIVNNVEYSAWMYFRDPKGTLLQSGDYNDAIHGR
jgi:gamma-glutamylaminecyclotransferase